jgi:cytoskeletal protein CcmA (bactofilin family)
MFSKKKKIPHHSSSSLSIYSLFQGEILFDDILRLDGKMEGKIIAKNSRKADVFIGSEAEVKADIVADSVIIAGKFTGKIFTTQKIEIKKNARVEGMIFTTDLIIQKKSFFHGQSFMMQHLSLEQKNNIKINFQKKNFTINSNLLEDFNYPTYRKLEGA